MMFSPKSYIWLLDMMLLQSTHYISVFLDSLWKLLRDYIVTIDPHRQSFHLSLNSTNDHRQI